MSFTCYNNIAEVHENDNDDDDEHNYTMDDANNMFGVGEKLDTDGEDGDGDDKQQYVNSQEYENIIKFVTSTQMYRSQHPSTDLM